MLNRKKAQSSSRNDPPPAQDNSLAEGLTEPDAEAHSSWSLSVPFPETSYWDTTGTQQYGSPTELTQEDSTDPYATIPSGTFLSTDYSDQVRHVQPSVPFNFSSSSLSAALSLAAVSPSSTHMNSPISSQTSPMPFVNDTQFSNAHQRSIPSLSSVVQDHLIPPTQSYLSPSPTSSSSPDLSALGSQDLSVPIPFDNPSPEDCSPNYDSAASDPQPPSIEVTTYPTPVPSPIIEVPVPFTPGQDHSPDQTASRHYRTSAEKKLAESKAISAKKSSRTSVKGGPPRLSASLPAIDKSVLFFNGYSIEFSDYLALCSVLAYACGHESCWPSGESKSRNCYCTSQELYDHGKVEHSDDVLGCERPYRCGLPECGKGWKVCIIIIPCSRSPKSHVSS